MLHACSQTSSCVCVRAFECMDGFIDACYPAFAAGSLHVLAALSQLTEVLKEIEHLLLYLVHLGIATKCSHLHRYEAIVKGIAYKRVCLFGRLQPRTCSWRNGVQ